MKFPADGLNKEQIKDRRWVIHAIMSLGLVLVVMSVSAINVALPTLARELGATATQLQWIVDSYALVFAGLLLFAGAVGDRFGRRRAFMIGMAIFGTFTLLSAFATSAEQLTIYRGLSGIGAALIMPATLSIIATTFKDKKERAKAIALWAGFAGAAGAIGPLLSGLMLNYFWWGSIFLIPIPVVIVALVGGFVTVPDSKDTEAESLDFMGAALSIVSLGAILYAVIEAPSNGWLTPETLGVLITGIVLAVAFVFWEKRSSHPMLPMEFFKSRRFSTGSLTLMLTFFALFGMFFVLIQFFQFVLGYSALKAAVYTLPAPIALIIMSSGVPKLVEKFGTRKIVSIGLLVVAGGFIMLSTLDPTTGYLPILVGLVLLGLGMGMAMPPATEAIIGAVPARKYGVGSAVNDTTRELGGALGIAVLGSVLNTGYRTGMTDVVASLPVEAGEFVNESIVGAQIVAHEIGEGGAQLLDTANQAFTDGMVTTMLVGAGFLIVSSMIVARFMADEEEPIKLEK